MISCACYCRWSVLSFCG